MQTVEQKDQDEQATIKIQRAIRKMLERRYKEKEESRERKRKYAALEILENEQKYVENLNVAIEVYYKPLQELVDSNKAPISQKDLDTIFSDLKVILEINTVFLQQLESRLDEYDSESTLIGDVFVGLAPVFKLYTQYIRNYDTAMVNLMKCKQYTSVYEILQKGENDSRAGYKTLPSFLILPIQRIPRYELLLGELLKHTLESHKDYQELLKAQESIQEVSSHLDEALKIAERYSVLSDIQAKFDSNVDIMEPHRKLIKTGQVYLLTEKRAPEQIVLHLFNDLLLVSRKTALSRFSFRNRIKLDSAIVQIDDDASDKLHDERFKDEGKLGSSPLSSSSPREIEFYPFIVMLHTLKVKLACQNDEERTEWINSIQESISSCQAEKTKVAAIDSNIVNSNDTAAEAAKKSREEDPDISLSEAINEMLQGCELVKYCKGGSTHFRRFQLSSDRKAIYWVSPGKRKSTSTVNFSSITNFTIGHKTKRLKKYGTPQWESKTFSIHYSNKTLDLVAKTRREFLVWSIGIRNLISLNEGEPKEEEEDDDDSSTGSSPRSNRIQSIQSNLKPFFFKNSEFQKAEFEAIGDAFAWGQGARGAIGDNDTKDQYQPKVIPDFLYLDVLDIACVNSSSAVLLTTKMLFTWGSNDGGKLGHGDTSDRLTPTLVKGLENVKIEQLSIGAKHMLAVDDRGSVWCWGNNKCGQLGIPDIQQSLEPQQISSLENIVTVHCGLFHSAAITQCGQVFTWGQGSHGELGHGCQESSKYPNLVSEFNQQKVSKVALGMWHSLALTIDGNVYSWGEPTDGQLGNGDITTSQNEPSLISKLADKNVVDIAAGGYHCACVTDDGKIYSWGNNIYGQLGIGEKETHSEPMLVSHLSHKDSAETIVCGANHCLVRCSSGKVYAWGAGTFGRLGIGLEEDQSQPYLIEFLLNKKVRRIAAGGAQSACVCAHMWVPDKDSPQCMKCNATFSVTRRRHHCRNCGGLFCANCTKHKLPLIRFGYDKPVRVCDHCFSILSDLKNL